MDSLFSTVRRDRRSRRARRLQRQADPSESSIGVDPDLGQGEPQIIDPSTRRLSVDEMDEMKQSDLMHIILSSPPVGPNTELRQMTADYVVKYIPVRGYDAQHELIKIQEVADRLQIKFSRLRKVVQNRGGRVYLIMDRVRGKSLEEIWKNLSFSESLAIARKLRVLIRKLRSATQERGGSALTGVCRSHFVRRFGLPDFPSCIMFMEHLFFWKVYGTQFHDTGIANRRYGFQQFDSFVFTHHNLTPGHIMVDEQGDLVLVNWQSAGYYPKHFESTIMYHWRELQQKEPRYAWGWEANVRWKWLCKYALGYDSHEAKILLKIRKKIQEAPPRMNEYDYLFREDEDY